MKHDYASSTATAKQAISREHPVLASVECRGERPTLETMAITAERLERIERNLNGISVVLFGSEPCDDCGRPHPEPSVRSLADLAFESSIRLERRCEEIKQKLAGNE